MSENNEFPTMKFSEDTDVTANTTNDGTRNNNTNFVLVEKNSETAQVSERDAAVIANQQQNSYASQSNLQDERHFKTEQQNMNGHAKTTTNQMNQSENSNQQDKKNRAAMQKKNHAINWKTFFTSMSGALAGCLLFLALFQGGAYFFGGNNNNSFGVSSSLVQSGGTVEKTNLTNVVDAVSPGVVTVLINKQQRTIFGGVENVQGLGSGVVYHRDGNKAYILTNTHVVEGATEIAVYRNDLTREELDLAKVQDYDADSDIAVLIIDDPDHKYNVTIDFANSSDLVIGQEVIAVGSPMGEEFSGSVTTGIISGLNRQLQSDNWGQKYQSFIQTDAAINGGNSGGGLIDTSGRLIGINSAKISSADNIGLAIPSNTILAILETLDVPQPQVSWEFENENIDKTVQTAL